MTVYALKINGLSNPIGYLVENPVLSWKIRDAIGKTQADAKIEVAVDAGFDHILWKTEGAIVSPTRIIIGRSQNGLASDRRSV